MERKPAGQSARCSVSKGFKGLGYTAIQTRNHGTAGKREGREGCKALGLALRLSLSTLNLATLATSPFRKPEPQSLFRKGAGSI